MVNTFFLDIAKSKQALEKLDFFYVSRREFLELFWSNLTILFIPALPHDLEKDFNDYK